MKFAVANVPQRTSLGRKDLPINTNTYNGMLAKAIPQWSTTQSPVALVQLRENYQCELDGCPAGYDGLHPNILGEFQIAQAFSRTLYSSFKYGKGPLVIPNPVPTRPLPIPSNFRVFSSPGGVTATWDPVYGSRGYEVQTRLHSASNFSTGHVQTNRYDQGWPLKNGTYDIMVRASYGNTAQGQWTALGSAVAQPQTAPAPQNVMVHGTDTGVTITWDPPVGPFANNIIEYVVILWDQDTPCAFINGFAFKSSPAHM